jgi:hypothetical protein
MGVARPKAFCKLGGIKPTEIGRNSCGVHGRFKVGS